MMKTVGVTLAFLMAVAFTGIASAEETAVATTDVFVTVNPNIGLQAQVPYVDMGTIQFGSFYGWIPWRVDANTQNVVFWAAASYLYKGDDPTDPVVPPILLDMSYGIHFKIADGGPVGGEDEVLDYTQGTDIDGFPGMETEAVEYEASTPGHMSQDCVMSVAWAQHDPERPTGEYSGKVRLYAMVVVY